MTSIGPYVLRGVLGAGGMGLVYEAMRSGGEPVALKVLHTARARDPDAVRRFTDEAVAGSLVKNPHVASVLDRGWTEDGIPYLVMPRLGGESLACRIRRDGMPSPRRAVQWVAQILDGVAAIHAAGIVHGDIKSDNVMIEALDARTDSLTLIDLGLARAWFTAGDDLDRDADMISGTPEYMAPEVIRGCPRSCASDIYGVGVVLYELVTGTTPFTGKTAAEIFDRHLVDDVVPPSLRVPGAPIPAVLDRIALRALAKDPADRFATARDLARALAKVAPRLPDQPPRTGASAEGVSPTLEWQPHRRPSAASWPGS